MSYKFLAFLNRLKFINRWGLMRGTPENVAEHTQQTSVFAHVLALIDRNVFGKDTDPNKTATYALYHETAETVTGDLPTPIKYFNPEIRAAYKGIEVAAEDKLLSALPPELLQAMTEVVRPEASREATLVKYADKLAAYIKCVEELSRNNYEFKRAHDTIEAEIKAYADQSVDYFMQNFVPAFRLTLDELTD